MSASTSTGRLVSKREPQCGSADLVGARARPDDPRPAPARRRPGSATRSPSGQCASTSLRALAGVANHPGVVVAEPRRRRCTTPRGAGVGRRAGHHAGGRPGCTCSPCGPGTWPSARPRRRRRSRRTSVVGRSRPMSTRFARPHVRREHGAEPARPAGNGEQVNGGVDGRAGDRAGSDVDALLGMSTATTGIASASTSAKDVGRVGPQRPGAGDADHAVDDDEIGLSRRRCRHIRRPARRKAGQTLLMGAFRIEQYRVGGRASAAQE